MTSAAKRSAMIFGVTGQDGILLTELLLQEGYDVVGFGRQASILRNPRAQSLQSRIKFAFGDIRDPVSVGEAIETHRPVEIYNLAAQSSPASSWKLAVETGEVNALAAHRLFEAARRLQPSCRIYQASTSEMFGATLQSPQNELTPLSPLNPYAAAKIYAHQMARIYRDSYGLFITCGILFNHESRYRDMSYLTQKVAYGAACAKLELTTSPETNEQGEPIVKNGKLSLGNLTAARDWGYAGDYVRAMWQMMQLPTPEDFVIGTGVLRTVGELCEVSYRIVGEDWRAHVISDPRFFRPLETGPTVADSTKARDKLNWTPSTPFETMLTDMISAHLERLGATRGAR
jgi:GDPmannose 4,6-dehydratase